MLRRWWYAFLCLILVYNLNGIKVYAFKAEVIKILKQDDRHKNIVFPAGVRIDEKNKIIYVLDAGRSKIILYNFNFLPYFSFDKGRGIESPLAIDIDDQGNLYVLQESYFGKPTRITVLNPAGIVEKEFFLNKPEYENIAPTSLCVSGNKIYLVGNGFPGILVIDKNTGKVLKHIKVTEEIEGYPTQISFCDVYKDSNGRLYFTSEDAGKFYVYDKYGNFLFKGGKKGGRYGQLSRPEGIAASPSLGVIIVMDYMRHTGLVYDYDDGRFLGEFGGEGWSPGWFAGPKDIDIDKEGRIYIVDTYNKRVQIIILTAGKEEGVWSPTFVTPLQPVK